MLHIIIYIILGVILFMLVHLVHHSDQFPRPGKEQEADGDDDRLTILIRTCIVVVIIGMVINTYFVARGTPWEGHLMEWLNMIIRLMHVVFGIAWIGASFYFVFLENSLNRTKDVRDELAGNLWAIHGGGFYYLEKFKGAPPKLPKELHWFKYEAYFTWLSGFSLLFVVYYFNASAFLVDDSVMKLSAFAAIAIGIGSFVVAWVMYDLLCKSPLVKNKILFVTVGCLLVAGFAVFYASVFSAKAAYIHFGAMLGTLMAGNVFFNIIPSQKAMVKAAKEGRSPDLELGKKAGFRSMHNNYFTLPVVFVMISNHFPSTFGAENPWLILLIITVATAGVKHYLNLKEKKQLNVWILPVSVLILLAGAFITAPAKDPAACKTEPGITEVYAIVQQKCTTCHSSKPTDPTVSAPPNGVMYDTPEQLAILKDKIMQRVVVTKTMPPGNKTAMTEEERDLIRCWINQGAKTK